MFWLVLICFDDVLPSFLNVLISSGWFSNVLAFFQNVLMSFVGLNYFGGFLEYFGWF